MSNRRAFRAITGATSAALALAAGCSTQRPSDDLAVVGQAAPAVALINEVAVNPEGADDGAEFIELRGTAGGSLENVYVVVTDGDGELTLVVNLGEACGADPCEFGSNGLLAIGDADNFGDAPAGTTLVGGTALDDGDLLDSAAASVVLFESTDAVTATAGDDWADLPDDITILDAVGFALDAGTDVYGDVDLDLDAQDNVRAISRLGDTANSAGAWYYCEELDGLDCTTASSNAPEDPALTPGDVNVGAGTPVGAGGAGGAAGTPEGGAPSTGGIPAGGAAGAEAGAAGTATAPTAGAAAVAGAAGAAGAPVAQGGAAAEAGAAGKSAAAGTAGEQAAAGAAASSGGTGGTRVTSSGGSGTGGARPTGGSTAAGGAQATGGSSPATGGSQSTGVGGTTTATGGETTDDYESDDDDSGCGCRAAGHSGSGSGALALLGAAVLLVRRRSQR